MLKMLQNEIYEIAPVFFSTNWYWQMQITSHIF